MNLGFPGGSEGKASAHYAGDQVRSLGWEDPLEKDMATPLQYSCLENPMDGGAWWEFYLHSTSYPMYNVVLCRL